MRPCTFQTFRRVSTVTCVPSTISTIRLWQLQIPDLTYFIFFSFCLQCGHWPDGSWGRCWWLMPSRQGWWRDGSTKRLLFLFCWKISITKWLKLIHKFFDHIGFEYLLKIFDLGLQWLGKASDRLAGDLATIFLFSFFHFNLRLSCPYRSGRQTSQCHS